MEAPQSEAQERHVLEPLQEEEWKALQNAVRVNWAALGPVGTGSVLQTNHAGGNLQSGVRAGDSSRHQEKQ